MVFRVQKIQNETFGEYLQEVRQSLGFDIAEVSLRTGIHKKFLKLLENGSYKDLPPDVYVKGFIKKLSSLYKVESTQLVSQFEKESELVKSQELKKGNSWKKFSKLLVLTPKTFSLAFTAVFLLGTLAYVGFQIKGMSDNPNIVVFEPASGSKLTDSYVRVTGKTDPGNALTINNEDVFVTENGEFSATVSVSPGQVNLVFSAVNKFDKRSEKIVSLVREDQEAITAPVILSEGVRNN